MATKPSTQTPFENEISLLDIIRFFKANIKIILFFVMAGGILGGLYGKLAGPIYQGSMLISSAKVVGKYVVDPKITLTKLGMSSYYSSETLLACNPSFYKGMHYDMVDFVKPSLTKYDLFIKFEMKNKDKKKIIDCLNLIENDIKLSEATLALPLIEMKKIKLELMEDKLKNNKDISEKLNDRLLKNLKNTGPGLSIDLLLTNIMINNTYEFKELNYQISELTSDLSSVKTREAGMVLPITIEQKSFPSLKLGLLLGLFLGGVLGFFISLYRNMAINEV